MIKGSKFTLDEFEIEQRVMLFEIHCLPFSTINLEFTLICYLLKIVEKQS
jgi:hypothetical protein